MARFFMAMNGKRINSLDDLRNNFNPNQMLAFFKAKGLHRWLEEQGCADELENLNTFDAGMDDDTLLSMLMALFELSDEQIAKAEAQMAKQKEKDDAVSRDTANAATPTGEKADVTDASAGTRTPTADSTEASPEMKQPSVEASARDTDGIGWQLCQLSSKDDNGKIIATCKSIGTDDLENSKIISGGKQRYGISNAFFFDGYFWAHIYTNSNGYCDVIWAKSRDCIHWEFDVELNTLLADKFFNVERIKVSDKHVFMLQSNASATSFVVYSPQSGWEERELDMDGIMSVSELEANLEDVYERNDYAGIVGIHRWETGIFKKENNWSHEIFYETNSGYTQFYGYSNYDYNDIEVHAFKDYLFVASGEDCNSFVYAELDQNQPSFSEVNLPDEVKITYYDRFFVFDNAMFVISTASGFFSRNDFGKLIFTTDGLDWKVCNIDSEKIVDVAFTGSCYIAIAEEAQGKVSLYSSETGDDWQKIQTLNFTRSGKTVVAGNDMILIFNGSTTGKYIVVKSPGQPASQQNPSADNDYLERVKNISAQVKAFIARELGVSAAVINDDTDIVADLHAEEWRIKLFGYQLGELLGVKFPNGEIPTKIIDIILAAVKNQN